MTCRSRVRIATLALASGRQQRINDSPVLSVCYTRRGFAKACERRGIWRQKSADAGGP